MLAYPDLPAPRARTMLRDGLTILLLGVFSWIGLRVHHDVARLASLGNGVTAAGNAVREGFSVAATASSAIPLAGGAIGRALHGAAGATGGNLAAIGAAGTASARHLATVLGLVVWLLPSLLLLAAVLPARIRQSRELTRLRRALIAPDATQRQALLAVRAAVSLPETVLLAYTPDPASDLRAGRYDGLVRAALESAGLRGGAARPR